MSAIETIPGRDHDLASPVPSRFPVWRPMLDRDRLINSLLVLLFGGFAVFQISRHAMWRDEVHAWSMVLASPTLPDLFHLMHYEGHPGLWHLLLWFVSFATAAPDAVQFVQGAFALGVIASIAFWSPFNRAEKLLLLGSYFILFEYTVPSRNYGIGVLLALLYADLRSRHPARTKTMALLLGLLANTNVFTLILSGSLALEYVIAAAGREQKQRGRLLRRLAPAAAIYAALLGASVATLWPAADISWQTTGAPQVDRLTLPHLTNEVIDFLSALLPLSQQAFWFPPGMIDGQALGAERFAIGVSAPLLIALVVKLFAERKSLLTIPGVTFAGSVLFSLVVYDCYARHWGIVFVAFVVAFWIYRAGSGRPSPISFGLLSVNALAGIVFTIQHWGIPFSNATATAEWVRNNAPAEAFLVGTPDTNAAPVAALLSRSAYFLECRCSDTFFFSQTRRDDFRPAELPPRLAEALQRAGSRPLIFLSGRALDEGQKRGLDDEGVTLTLLARIDGALVENFDIFAVSKATVPVLKPSL